jgi:hypothetical protein
VIILFFFTATTVSALDHSGTITADEIWYAADNPHNIVGSITVNAEVTLTLESGVEVQCVSHVGINVYGSLTIESGIDFELGYQSGISIHGTLTAVGTPGSGILFISYSTWGWDGISFMGEASGVFDHCTFEHIGGPSAIAGIFANSSGTVSAANTTFRDCLCGVSVSAGVVELTNVS